MRRLVGWGLTFVGMFGLVILLPGAPHKEMPGTVVFHEKGCEQCHGMDGVGTQKAPSLTGVGRRLTRAQIEKQILEGGQQMPAFGAVLDPAETEQLADWLVTRKAEQKNKELPFRAGSAESR